ncbi:hypothetical protein D3C87_1394950 [compost metagenome]
MPCDHCLRVLDIKPRLTMVEHPVVGESMLHELVLECIKIVRRHLDHHFLVIFDPNEAHLMNDADDLIEQALFVVVVACDVPSPVEDVLQGVGRIRMFLEEELHVLLEVVDVHEVTERHLLMGDAEPLHGAVEALESVDVGLPRFLVDGLPGAAANVSRGIVVLKLVDLRL